MKIILWFLGVLALFFFIWVWGGGPERAEREGVSPFIRMPINTETPGTKATPSNQRPSPNNEAPTEGEIRVTPA